MTEPLIRSLDSVRIGEDRQYIEFRFQDGRGEAQTIQIDFAYVEALAALFQQAFVSATLAARQGGNRWHGHDYLSVPRIDVEYPISVAVDVMTDRVVTMFMPGTPFQVSYSLPTAVASKFSHDLLTACDTVGGQVDELGRPPH